MTPDQRFNRKLKRARAGCRKMRWWLPGSWVFEGLWRERGGPSLGLFRGADGEGFKFGAEFA